jgi:site-specific DNA-methyltransferase (cytosine-N4-specific)
LNPPPESLRNSPGGTVAATTQSAARRADALLPPLLPPGVSLNGNGNTPHPCHSVNLGSVVGTVIEGDAFDLMKVLPNESIDLILTSPPYWGLRTYGLDHNWQIELEWKSTAGDLEVPPPYEWYRDHGGVLGLEPNPEWYVFHLAELFDYAQRKLKKRGSLWINVGDTYFARWSSIRDGGRQGLGKDERHRRRVPMGGYRQEKQLLLIPARFAIAMQERRWILRNDLIWYKPNVPPRPEKDRLKLAHEHFFHFVRRPTQGRAKYHYDMSQVEGDGHDVVTCYVRAGQDNHTATFPEDLIAPRILSSSPAAGVVLDPFAGTGRALGVALAYGRHALGFELLPHYVGAACKQMEEALDCRSA